MSEIFDLSVILTVHDETLVSGPTLACAEMAIGAAERAGVVVDRILALDNPTAAALDYFSQPALAGWRQVRLAEGDLGRARNRIVAQEAQGRFIAFLDADDLFSENWLALSVARLREAEAKGLRVIVHPELNWLFDGAAAVFCNPDQTSPLFLPQYFYFMNYYDSLCLSPKAAHIECPYGSRDIPMGLSFQDWQFAIETMAAGWVHVAAQDTIIFKRRRDMSLVTQSQGRRAIVRAIPAMAIDKVPDLAGAHRAALVPPAPLPAVLPHIAKVNPPGIVTRARLALQHRLSGARAQALATDAVPPWYGSIFAARVAQARSLATSFRMLAKATQTASQTGAAFDHAYYLARSADLMRAERTDLVGHYLRAGWVEGRMPSPYFSGHAYLSRNRDVAKTHENPFLHWLRTGRAEGRIGAPFRDFQTLAAALGLDPHKAEQLWAAAYADIRQRLEYGELGRMVHLAAANDPLVGQTWPEALQVKVPPFHSEMVVSRLAAMIFMQHQAGQRPARAVICVNRARWGSARRLEGLLAHALAAIYGPDQVVVISTETAGMPAKGKVPDGVRWVDLQTAAPELSGDPRQKLLAEFLRSLAPEIVFNVNSRLMWDMMEPYGVALATTLRIVGCFLCNDQTPYGAWSGYPLTRFYRHFDQMAAVVTDSLALAADLTTTHLLPQRLRDRLVTLHAPVDATRPLASPPKTVAGRRPQVFWAGRFDPQKRPELVYAVAKAMPEADFRVWGEAVVGANPVLPPKPPNLKRLGAYENFNTLPLDEADVWLYTSAWDGVPQMLLEVAMTGVPLVGSLVGGTAEVLLDGMATGIAGENAADYVAALRAVLADPLAARARALKLRLALLDRTEAAYLEKVRALVAQCQPAPFNPG